MSLQLFIPLIILTILVLFIFLGFLKRKQEKYNNENELLQKTMRDNGYYTSELHDTEQAFLASLTDEERNNLSMQSSESLTEDDSNTESINDYLNRRKHKA